MGLDVAIASLGRFHALDLARELRAHEHRVTFFSDVPRHRLARFGFPPSSGATVWSATAATVLRRRLARYRRVVARLDHWRTQALERALDRQLRRCDVLIAMSGMVVESGIRARERLGSRFWLERGSMHILEQRRILCRAPGASADGGIDDAMVSRELAGYAAADRIVIPTSFVKETFLREGVPEEKLFVNPYGVDLSMFPWRRPARADKPTLLVVGNWSWQKGSDLLVSIGRDLGLPLLHVGAIGDVPFPDIPGWRHLDPMPQWQLSDIYAQAHVLVAPSRQDGLSVVIPQALASGLHVVCSRRSGGQELATVVGDPGRLAIITEDDPAALLEALRQAMSRALSAAAEAPEMLSMRHALSWEAYGSRYHAELVR